jgi:hypothetical protein
MLIRPVNIRSWFRGASGASQVTGNPVGEAANQEAGYAGRKAASASGVGHHRTKRIHRKGRAKEEMTMRWHGDEACSLKTFSQQYLCRKGRKSWSVLTALCADTR